MLKVLGLTFLVAFLPLGVFALYGGKAGHSIVALSGLSLALCGLTAVLSMIVVTSVNVRDSGAARGQFEWIELRKRNLARWLGRLATVAIIVGFCAGIVAAVAFAKAATYLNGDASREATTISREPYSRRPARGGWCSDFVEVNLSSGESSICVDHAKSARRVLRPPAIECARIGDTVEVELNRTILGTTATILSVVTPRAGC